MQVAMGLLLAPQGRRTRKGKGSYVEVLVGFGILTFSAIVLRLELCALLAPLVLESLWSGAAGVSELFIVGLVVAGGSHGAFPFLCSGKELMCPCRIDDWDRLVLLESPRLARGLCDLLQHHRGAGVKLGRTCSQFPSPSQRLTPRQVSPWHYYFTSSLPRLLNLALPFSIFAMLIDRRARRIGFPALAFIGVLSCLPHKEWRFFVYAIPALNICAAAGIQSLQVLCVPV